jgi:hypothetical protein
MGWNNLFYFYFPLLLGILFVSVGIILFRHKLLRIRAKTVPARFFAACFLLIFPLVGIVLVVALLLGPWPSERSRAMREVIKAEAGQVNSIEIGPHPSDNYPCLVREPLRITDRAEINRLCSALAGASQVSPNHPHAVWYCVLVLHKTSGVHRCVVSSTRNQGTLVSFSSNEAQGWNYGEFRIDALGSILEALAARRNGK